jgi:trypsin-like peptidase
MGGRGVLIPGGFILTAAHCLQWTANGYMAMDSLNIEHFTTSSGKKLMADVLAVEPVNDVAIMAAPDGQALPEEQVAFEEFCETTEPVPLYRGRIKPNRDRLPVLILNHGWQWVNATVEVFQDQYPRLRYQAEKPISGGSSGGPVVTLDGKLVGLVSWSSEQAGVMARDGPKVAGMASCPLYALPVWIVSKLAKPN